MTETTLSTEQAGRTTLLGDLSSILKQVVQRALTDMRELAEAGYRAQSDTFAVISRRTQENIQEFTDILQPKK